MGSPQTRARTHVACIGGWILNHWTTREVSGKCHPQGWLRATHLPVSLGAQKPACIPLWIKSVSEHTDGPGVQSPCSHCGGYRFSPWLDRFLVLQGMAKKREGQLMNSGGLSSHQGQLGWGLWLMVLPGPHDWEAVTVYHVNMFPMRCICLPVGKGGMSFCLPLLGGWPLIHSTFWFNAYSTMLFSFSPAFVGRFSGSGGGDFVFSSPYPYFPSYSAAAKATLADLCSHLTECWACSWLRALHF